ncbi:pyruvate dehydrogenase (acetyl-transferring) E1 component subunit alpha [Thermorudis peleae]|uniref:pyruvate dehydrogenase (acetyl-transferring) E1 component subunit alpha n=1 Tax=Thermorudis peleae TaxID=1382356 RepID=UPI00056FF8E5|nr:pyruvate dehydrogenase (acetyl-transferring) E1 component subunit alpha [Thermorudis peleae]MBX6754157.1 pyruvate dehydrogenase (acetyl-transferring) E1 component subunit alpha [Thermorudis peleae]
MTSTVDGRSLELSLPKSELLELYRRMVLIRRFEEAAAEQYTLGKIAGFLHLYIGEEAVAVGALHAKAPQDHVLTHYRDHGYALALGLDPKRCMAELFGRADGVVGGRGGSMHFADASKRFWGGYAIVAGLLPIAVGLGLASAYQKQDAVALAFFGDGATNNGAFHESLNFAALWKLPVLFICENNLYGMGTAVQYASAVREMYRKACAYDIPAEQVDGQDVLAVYEATKRALEHCRSGKGPYFLEALTYRFRGHSMADAELYRTKEEVEDFRRQRDPIVLFRAKLLERQVATEDELNAIDEAVAQQIAEAVRFADESPAPAPDTLFDYVYADPITVR